MGAKADPYELVKYLALGKAQEVARHYEDAVIIGADTFVIDRGKFIGKPKTKEEARETLKNFSGREHEIVTGFAVIDTRTGESFNDYGKARIKFRELSDEEIDDYVAIGEPMKLAGSYGMTQRAAVFMESINGDFYSIIGLPLSKIYIILRNLGINVLKP